MPQIPLPFKVVEGQEAISSVQGSLRPSMFGTYEYVFPESSLGDVVASLGLIDDEGAFTKLGMRGFALRKALKLKKIPKTYTDIKGNKVKLKDAKPGRILLRTGVSCYAVGVRYDEIGERDFAAQGKWYQEML